MTETQRERYAYGKDYIGDCPCPAAAAGYSPKNGDESTKAAEFYDDLIRQGDVSAPDSTVPAETAKEMWLDTIEKLRDRYGDKGPVEAAEDIADELGWL
jgi:hypothetical protein